MTVVTKPQWECQYCNKTFSSETRFMNHTCKDMEKSDSLRSPDGLLAYEYYCKWMQKQRRKAPTIETFQHSRYFTSFFKFVKYCKTHSIVYPEKYIDIMMNRDLSPMLWCRDECFSFYLDYCDNKADPMEQVVISVDTILTLSEQLELSPSELFDTLHYREIFALIQQQKLSLWLLFGSEKFRNLMKSLPKEERVVASRLINYNRWLKKIGDFPEVISDMKVIAKELGI